MSLKSFATLALATGLAAASPISAPVSKRQNNIFGNGFNGAVVNGFSGNGFNFADGFNNFNQQQQVIQIQEQNLQIIDNGFQQQVIQQVNQVLVVDQVNNGFNNDLNNIFRKSNFQNQFQQVATVMLVVQEIQIAVDDGRGNQFQQNIFAQSAVIANRGAQQTQTVMVFDSRTLIAQDILGNNAFGNLGQFGGVAGATGALNAFPTKTQGVQLFGAKPTWSSVAADPAATLGAIWQGAVEDLQKNDNDEADNKLNEQIAAQEKQALDEAQKQQEQEQQKQQKQGQEQQKQEQEQQKQGQEQQKQEQQKQQQEQQKAEEAAKKAEEEAAKKAE